jgi:hypothetical protein
MLTCGLLALQAPRGQQAADLASSAASPAPPARYFYRHTEPGTAQATGEWTAEEVRPCDWRRSRCPVARGLGDAAGSYGCACGAHTESPAVCAAQHERFLDTARRFGVGDKWGERGSVYGGRRGSPWGPPWRRRDGPLCGAQACSRPTSAAAWATSARPTTRRSAGRRAGASSCVGTAEKRSPRARVSRPG